MIDGQSPRRMPSPLETAQPPSTFEPNEPSFSLRSLKSGLRPTYRSSLASSRETLLDTIHPLCARPVGVHLAERRPPGLASSDGHASVADLRADYLPRTGCRA